MLKALLSKTIYSIPARCAQKILGRDLTGNEVSGSEVLPGVALLCTQTGGSKFVRSRHPDGGLGQKLARYARVDQHVDLAFQTFEASGPGTLYHGFSEVMDRFEKLPGGDLTETFKSLIIHIRCLGRRDTAVQLKLAMQARAEAIALLSAMLAYCKTQPKARQQWGNTLFRLRSQISESSLVMLWARRQRIKLRTPPWKTIARRMKKGDYPVALGPEDED